MTPVAPPLEGIRVLELGQYVAGPFTTRLLADFGAEVIKVEPPHGGDELRQWRSVWQGTSFFWDIHARNKKSVTLDLRTREGRRIAQELALRVDVLVENFRPGTLEKWGLDPPTLRQANPALIVVRISGFGQTGPYRGRPGWASVGEAMSGLRSVTGFSDRPPTRVGISLGDSVAGMFGVIGVLLALVQRFRGGDGRGELIDVALFESVFALMESLLPEYEKLGLIWQPSGSAMPGVAPTNVYPTVEGGWTVIGGNSDKVFPVLMETIGRPDLARDVRFAHNAGRVAAADLLDDAIAAWTRTRSQEEIERILGDAGVPVGRVYRAPDILADAHYQAREAWIRAPVQREGVSAEIPVQGICPKLTEHPGRIAWLGPRLGQHNDEVYRDLLGMTAADIAGLKAQGVI